MASALTTHPPHAESIPFWLWPTVLSLDAPLVAVAWLPLFGRSFQVPVSWPLLGALGLSVWLIYIVDRLLDGLKEPPQFTSEPQRHRFYRRYRWWIVPFALALAAFTLWLALHYFDPVLLRLEILLGVTVGLYFATTHLTPARLKRLWPKEFMVACVFAAGIALPIAYELPVDRWTLLPSLVLLTATFWINALGIECWENAPDRSSRRCLRPRLSAFWGTHLVAAAMIAAALAVALALAPRIEAEHTPLYLAIAFSAILLAALDFNAPRFSRPALRVMADAALLTPFLFLLH